ncbi:MAG: thioredoxin domain-containing protein [Ignavibacteriaceae bacterium]|nr:thioredoxin domain-containing protein [Ignavibacteriaceae bacterium]
MENLIPNKLINEKSPYLLQHAYNPVEWYAWNDEAFNKAQEEDKPVFLSIGYSTCHWCHVMEKESFEDEEIAGLMNKSFISIKVDREERPDIDAVYMAVCQVLTGSGGWPLTILMTPDKKPFFAGTYFPKESKYGRTGLKDLLPKIEKYWKNERQDLLASANQITDAMQQTTDSRFGKDFTSSIMDLAFRQYRERFDHQFGGFGNAPKFPTPHNLLFLLRYFHRTKNNEALEIVTKTLTEMRKGGMFDQIGFGFHRYSTDRQWLVPHFEKMLYDQAMLMLAFTEAFQVTGNELFKQTVYEIYEYIDRELTSSNGAFFSAEDADSEGEEGKFYLWRTEEIRKILGKDADLFINVFQVKEEGNFLEPFKGENHGENILHLLKTIHEFADENNLHSEELNVKVSQLLKKLFEEREKRIHPHKDDKILTDWNGLMIAALAKAGAVFDEEKFVRSAEYSVRFILGNLKTNDGLLLHRFRDGDAAINGNLDDYAFIVFALLELYEAAFKVDYLQQAESLQKALDKHFADDVYGGYFFTSDFAEELIFRQKEIYDGAIPSGNAVTMLNLLKLARYTGNLDYENKALDLSRAFHEQVKATPMGHPFLMVALEFMLSESCEIVIVGDEKTEKIQNAISVLRRKFIPNKIVICKNPKESNVFNEIYNYTKNLTEINGEPAFYLCKNFTCELPTNDFTELLNKLGEG